MQSPNIPEKPGITPARPDETPSAPTPEVPVPGPDVVPEEQPIHPDNPEAPGTRKPPDPGVEQAALAARIP